jgi:tRNA 2-thiouridine synthesizing protein A
MHQILDMRMKLCPIPVIRTQQAIATMQVGEILEVICTDPGAEHDIPAWCRIFGHEVINISHEEDDIIIRIKVLD